MFRRALAAFALALAAVTLTSCIESSFISTPEPSTKGTVFVFAGDAPLCDVLTFRVLVTGLTLTPQGGTTGVSILPSAASIKMNFAALRECSTIMAVESVEEGTYSEGSFALSIPELVYFDPSSSPPIKSMIATLATSSPKASIEPALKVVRDKISVLRVDFDLPRSIEVDSQGQVTGNANLTFTFAPVTASGSQGYGEFDALGGFVRSVSPFSATEGFTGSFLLQLISGTGPAVTVNLTSTTKLVGIPAMNQLATGSYVEVDGFVDANGYFVAKYVEVEDREILELKKVAFLGYVLSASKDANGNVTQFSLVARQEEPDASIDVPFDSVVEVNVSPSTVFQFSSRDTNFANLTFDAAGLTAGQEVVVHGTFTKTTAQPTTVAADKVYLKLQTVQGNFSSLLQAGSDDKTGAFRLDACLSLLRNTPLLVLTNSQTAFVGVSGLSALTARPTLLVKGLPFFQPRDTTLNGVAVPAGTIVLLAKQVHQLP